MSTLQNRPVTKKNTNPSAHQLRKDFDARRKDRPMSHSVATAYKQLIAKCEDSRPAESE